MAAQRIQLLTTIYIYPVPQWLTELTFFLRLVVLLKRTKPKKVNLFGKETEGLSISVLFFSGGVGICQGFIGFHRVVRGRLYKKKYVVFG